MLFFCQGFCCLCLKVQLSISVVLLLYRQSLERENLLISAQGHSRLTIKKVPTSGLWTMDILTSGNVHLLWRRCTKKSSPIFPLSGDVFCIEGNSAWDSSPLYSSLGHLQFIFDREAGSGYDGHLLLVSSIFSYMV